METVRRLFEVGRELGLTVSYKFLRGKGIDETWNLMPDVVSNIIFTFSKVGKKTNNSERDISKIKHDLFMKTKLEGTIIKGGKFTRWFRQVYDKEYALMFYSYGLQQSKKYYFMKIEVDLRYFHKLIDENALFKTFCERGV